jgi:hypothetical protein
MFVASDFPVYQYLNTSDFYTQVGSDVQVTVGLSHRFFANEKSKKDAINSGDFYCPMHPEVTSSEAGRCSICGMELIKKQ